MTGEQPNTDTLALTGKNISNQELIYQSIQPRITVNWLRLFKNLKWRTKGHISVF